MESTQESTDERASTTAGLRELADFLDAHPSVPLPIVSFYGSYFNGKAQIAEWVDGLDEIEVKDGVIPSRRSVVRHFAGLTVTLDVQPELVGVMVEKPTFVDELMFFTPAEIIARASEVAA